MPGYVSDGWGGLMAPVKTPQPIHGKLYRMLVTAMADPATHATMIKLGAESLATTPAEFAAVIKRDWKSFGDAIRVSGIKPN